MNSDHCDQPNPSRLNVSALLCYLKINQKLEFVSSLLFSSLLLVSKYLFDKTTIKSIRARVLFQKGEPRTFLFYSRTLNMRRHRQIALLGFPGVGKSSLAHHFVYKHYSNEYDPNIKTSSSRPSPSPSITRSRSSRSSASVCHCQSTVRSAHRGQCRIRSVFDQPQRLRQ